MIGTYTGPGLLGRRRRIPATAGPVLAARSGVGMPAAARASGERRRRGRLRRNDRGEPAAEQEAGDRRADQRRALVLVELLAPVGDLGDLAAQLRDRDRERGAVGLDRGADLVGRAIRPSGEPAVLAHGVADLARLVDRHRRRRRARRRAARGTRATPASAASTSSSAATMKKPQKISPAGRARRRTARRARSSTKSTASTMKPPAASATTAPGDELPHLRADLGLGELDLVADQQRRVLGDLGDRRRDVGRDLFLLSGQGASAADAASSPPANAAPTSTSGRVRASSSTAQRQLPAPARAGGRRVGAGAVGRRLVAEFDVHSGGSSSKIRRHSAVAVRLESRSEQCAEPGQHAGPDEPLDDGALHGAQ